MGKRAVRSPTATKSSRIRVESGAHPADHLAAPKPVYLFGHISLLILLYIYARVNTKVPVGGEGVAEVWFAISFGYNGY
jgi:hypothetical protein